MDEEERVFDTEENYLKASIKEMINQCNDLDLLYLINSLLGCESGN